jgi:hypothetical protein
MRRGDASSSSGRSRSQNSQSLDHAERTLKWTRWQGLAAVGATLIALAGIAFTVIDRLSPPAVSPPAPHTTCSAGSVCLWPEQRFVGKVWKWTRGTSPDGPLPGYLRNHVGSFESQTTACFIDLEDESDNKHPVFTKDWSERYTGSTRFGLRADVIQAEC